MRQDYMEWAYETMACGLMEAYRMPGVENAFSGDDYCLERYGDVLEAYGSLCQRLGTGEDDTDVERIINAFLDIQRELCYRMYRYGARFGMGKSK